jgi:choline-glycine betaine transporter
LEGADSGKEKVQVKKGVDPLTFIFWGILLAGYGLYAAYSSYVNPVETEKVLAIGPYVVVVVFGVIVALKGYRDYGAEKKMKENSV